MPDDLSDFLAAAVAAAAAACTDFGCSFILLQFLFENFIGNKAEQSTEGSWRGEDLPGGTAAKHIETTIAAAAAAIYALDVQRLLLPFPPPTSPTAAAYTACCVRLVLVIVIVAALYRNLQSICRAVRPGMASCPCVVAAPSGA